MLSMCRPGVQAGMAAPDTDQIKAVVFDCFGVLYVQSYRLKEMLRNQPLIDLTQELRKDYKVGLLSNMSEATMSRYFTKDERDRLFDAVVLSGDVGVAKPHPEIFHAVLNRLGVSPAGAVFIDDDDTNVLSARSVGMQAICYQDTVQLLRELNDRGVDI